MHQQKGAGGRKMSRKLRPPAEPVGLIGFLFQATALEVKQRLAEWGPRSCRLSLFSCQGLVLVLKGWQFLRMIIMSAIQR